MNSKIGIYPGTFDPLTNGHFDVIKRSLLIVDQLIIGVANNSNKVCLLSMEERKNIILADIKNNITIGKWGNQYQFKKPYEPSWAITILVRLREPVDIKIPTIMKPIETS